MARSMLSEYNVSHLFWVKVINTACYYSNCLYCHRLKEKTPYELLNDRKPNIAYFRVFGCKCYILKKDTRLASLRRSVMKDSYLDTPLQAKHIECGIWQVVLFEEVHNVEFDETKGSQDENENLEDVRGIQLLNGMKHVYW